MSQSQLLPSRQGRVSRWGMVALLGGLGVAAAGCTPAGPDDSKLPPEVQDPATLRTPAGALELYKGALQQLPGAFDQVMLAGAVLTDELAALPTPLGIVGRYTALDSRQNLTGAADLGYSQLHRTRAQAREARGFLVAYATDTAAARNLRGHLYAVEGYADVLLADLYCSGIPLSTVDFQGDYTLAAGSRTSEVYRAAVALFDSALALATDSVAFQRLAAVGRGRALLALGQYAEAAAAVAAVPTDYRYRVEAPAGVSMTWSMWDFIYSDRNYAAAPGVPSVGVGEGLNGLDFMNDPRAGGTLLGSDFYGHDMYFPTKYYPVNPTVQLTLADGIEARLIEAEAALQAGDDRWLALLNELRTGTGAAADTVADTLGVTGCDAAHICGTSPGGSDPSSGQPSGGFSVPAGYGLAGSYTIDPVSAEIRQYCYDYSWYEPCYSGGTTTVYVYVPTGTGGVSGLGALADPGTSEGRVDLLFQERAFWLYLTAHREGDFRRLVRQYDRVPETVYPTGVYVGGSGVYGSELVMPVPQDEQWLNPKYAGCFHHNA